MEMAICKRSAYSSASVTGRDYRGEMILTNAGMKHGLDLECRQLARKHSGVPNVSGVRDADFLCLPHSKERK